MRKNYWSARVNFVRIICQKLIKIKEYADINHEIKIIRTVKNEHQNTVARIYSF